MWRSPKVLLVVLGVLCLVSCGESDDPVSPPGGGEQELTPTIALAQAAAVPLAPVAITGLPVDRDDLYGLVTVITGKSAKAVGDTVTHQVFIEHREDGTYHLTVPFHPTTPKAGGTVEFRVTNGSNINSTVTTLEIAALPAADGAFAVLVGSLQTLLDGWLPIHRTSREELRNTPTSEFSDNWYPLYFAQDVIDNPDNPNSLRAIVDGTAPHAAGDDFDLDLLDRVIGLVGMQELLDDNVAHLDSMIAWADTLEDGNMKSLAANQPQGALTISTARQLDYFMTVANASRRGTEGHPGEILQATGLGIGALGVVTLGAPVVGALGASLWAYQTMEEAKSKLLPSTFEQGATSCEFAQVSFKEDEPGPAQWSNFRIAGQSEGMSIDKLALSAIMQFVGLRGSFGKWAEGIPEIAGAVGKFALGEGGNALINAASGAVTIPPRVWPSVDASHPNDYDSSINAGSAVSINQRNYRPEQAGQSTLQVATKSGHYGYQATLVHQVVTVDAIKVTVTPGAKNVEPGDKVEFSAEVESALDDTLEWTTTGGTLDVNSNTTATLNTPPEAWKTPIIVKARATTTDGARGKPGAPERAGRGTVTSRKGEIVIDPLFECVKPGKTLTYSAVIIDFPPEDQEVSWSAERGTFIGNVYTAPGTPGTDVITARSVVDPDVEGNAFVQVSQCVCWFSASMFGEVTNLYTGEFAIMDGNAAITVLTLAVTDDTTYPALGGQIIPGLEEGAIGQFPIVMNYSPNISTLYIGMDDEDPEMVSPVLNLLVNSGGKVEGFITGEVHRLDDNGIAGTVSLDIHFRGETGFISGGNACEER